MVTFKRSFFDGSFNSKFLGKNPYMGDPTVIGIRPTTTSDWNTKYPTVTAPDDIILCGTLGGPSGGSAGNDFDQTVGTPTFGYGYDSEAGLATAKIDNADAIYNSSTSIYEPSTGGAGSNSFCIWFRFLGKTAVAGSMGGKRNAANYYHLNRLNPTNVMQALMRNHDGTGSPSVAGTVQSAVAHPDGDYHDMVLKCDFTAAKVAVISQLETVEIAIATNTWESMLLTATTMRIGVLAAGGGGPPNNTEYSIGYLWEGTIPSTADIEGILQ